MSATSNRVVRHFLAGACAILASGAVQAQAYPSKPIHWVVPFAPGGPLDVITRLIGRNVSERVGQPVVVDNKPSAGGIVGAESVARAAPDGYTILTHGSYAAHKFLYPSLPFDVQKDLQPITIIARSAMVLYVASSVPARNLDEFIAYAKKNPGKIAYASSGVGQPFHLAMELFMQRTGTEMLHVPYKGSAQIIPEFVAGRIQATFFNAVPQLLSQVKAGKIRALAIAAPARMDDISDVPTFAEAGIANFDPSGLVGVSAPAGTPRPIVERLNREIRGVLADSKEVKAMYDKLNMDIVTTTPEEFARTIQDEIDKWGPIIRRLGISLN